MKRPAPVLAVLLLVVPAFAQQSTNFKLEESTFNAGGNPNSGTVLVSANFRVTLDSIGDTVSATSTGSASYRMEAGFPSAYPPPGEVHNLKFTDGQTLQWDPERSIGTYGLYAGVAADFGICLEGDIDTESTIVADSVPASEVHYYIVTAKNRLGEEGTPGTGSGGSGRSLAPCP